MKIPIEKIDNGLFVIKCKNCGSVIDITNIAMTLDNPREVDENLINNLCRSKECYQSHLSGRNSFLRNSYRVVDPDCLVKPGKQNCIIHLF